MKQATFLWKNERGIYFFRARVPKQLAEYFQRSEIKRSLQTDSYRLALKLASAYRVELDKEMAKLEKGPYTAFQTTIKGKVLANVCRSIADDQLGPGILLAGFSLAAGLLNAACMSY